MLGVPKHKMVWLKDEIKPFTRHGLIYDEYMKTNLILVV